LSEGTPIGIDDLKARVLDALEQFQDYVRNSDSRAWEQFWTGDDAKNENTCRDRIIDALRPRLDPIALFPESLMPELKRADILAHLQSAVALPIEIKGQWHPQVWNAASTQLYDRYSRDWRADDRGIYLVMWFGADQSMPTPIDGEPKPTSAKMLQERIADGLTAAQRSVVDVVVLDVSKPNKQPKPSKSKGSKRVMLG
jgi:hypothetical protein